jgi:hypothetical protein
MKKVIINLSNRTFYTLVVIGLVVLFGVGVYATLSPGSTPNPGHNIQDIGPPTGCANGQVLQFVNETIGWACTSAGGVDTRCDEEGNCQQVCIGNDCQSSWPSGGTGEVVGGWYGYCIEYSGYAGWTTACLTNYLAPPGEVNVIAPTYCDFGQIANPNYGKCACPSGYTLVRSPGGSVCTLNMDYQTVTCSEKVNIYSCVKQ